MSTEKVIGLAERAQRKTAELPIAASSEDQVALLFVDQYRNRFRYVPAWNRWLEWDRKRWQRESTGAMFGYIRELLREAVSGTKDERSTASASFVAGVERLARYDQRIVVLPDQLDADPWLFNTQSGIVDLRTGTQVAHDPDALLTRIAAASVNADQGRELWAQFITDVTQGNTELAEYLQRIAGYFATGVITEDVLIYLFGLGSNGKSSFAEAIAAAMGDYAMVFPSEVLMESKGERHPTELAQFQGARLALSSEPSSTATWNDARVKSMTGDATISARYMRSDFFTFPRTHKTMLVGNHMPRLNAVTHAIRRRVQMVPFRAVFTPAAGPGMRERLKSEALGSILAWIIAGAAAWQEKGTTPPACVRDLTENYLSGQDDVVEWQDECCERDAQASELSSNLYRNYVSWCERTGARAKSNRALAISLVEAGFEKRATMIGKVFYGLKLRAP